MNYLCAHNIATAVRILIRGVNNYTWAHGDGGGGGQRGPPPKVQ